MSVLKTLSVVSVIWIIAAGVLVRCKNKHYENMPMQYTEIFKVFAQNIDCGYTLEPPRRGGSNEYPQSMFWSKNKKNRYTPVKPQFFYIKVGFKGVNISRTYFPDDIYDQLICPSLSLGRFHFHFYF